MRTFIYLLILTETFLGSFKIENGLSDEAFNTFLQMETCLWLPAGCSVPKSWWRMEKFLQPFLKEVLS